MIEAEEELKLITESDYIELCLVSIPLRLFLEIFKETTSLYDLVLPPSASLFGISKEFESSSVKIFYFALALSIFITRLPNYKVDNDSDNSFGSGETWIISIAFESPCKLSFRMWVNFDSLYGI